MKHQEMIKKCFFLSTFHLIMHWDIKKYCLRHVIFWKKRNSLFNCVKNFIESFIILSVGDFHAERGWADHLQSATNCVIKHIERIAIDKFRYFARELISSLNKDRNEGLKCWDLERVVKKATIVLPARVASRQKSIIQVEQLVGDVRLFHADLRVEYFLYQLRAVNNNCHYVKKPDLNQVRIQKAEFCDNFKLFYKKIKNIVNEKKKIIQLSLSV